MGTMCIQCAMSAILDGRTPTTFDEDPEAHVARCHADPVKTQAERKELEERLAARFIRHKIN